MKVLDMQIAVNIILFIAGLVIGNWLAIGRDKRKEFNEAADEVHLTLIKQKENIKNGRAVKRGPEEKDLEKFKRRISFFKKKSFNRSLKKYKDVTSGENWNRDYAGDTSYKDPEKVINAINGLIEFTNRK
jgi:hypothetical protein